MATDGKTAAGDIVKWSWVGYDGPIIADCGLAGRFSYNSGSLKMFKDDTTRPPNEEINPISQPDERYTRTWILLVFGLLILLPTAWFVSGKRVVPFTGVEVGGLMQPDVTVLNVLSKPGDVLSFESALMVVKTTDGEELPFTSPVGDAEVEAVHVERNQTLHQEEPVLTVRDPYRRDYFGYRLLMAAVVWLISLPLCVLALLLLATGLDLDFSDFRVGILRTVAFLGWAVASTMVLWFNRVPIVVVDGLGDLGILVWLAVVIVLLVVQLWVFGALFRLEWFETFVGTLVLLCLTFSVWKAVDFGTAQLQSQMMSSETASVN